MDLGVAGGEIVHVAAARGIGPVGFWIGRARPAETALPLAAALKIEGVLDGVPQLMSQQPHARLSRRPLRFEHLRALETRELGVREVEWQSDARHPGRREQLIGKPEWRMEAKGPPGQLGPCPLESVAHA